MGALKRLSNHGKCGKIIDTDLEAAEGIISFFSGNRKKLSIECQKSVEQFGMEHYIKKIEDLFDSII